MKTRGFFCILMAIAISLAPSTAVNTRHKPLLPEPIEVTILDPAPTN